MSDLSNIDDFDSNPGSGLDFRRYAGVVWKRKWTIFLTMAVGISLTAVYTLRLPKKYEASARVVVNPQAPRVFGAEVQDVVQLGTGSFWSNTEYYNTQLEIIRGHDLIRTTVTDRKVKVDGKAMAVYDDARLLPELLKDPDLPKEERIDRASAMLRGALTAEHKRDSRILTVTVNHTDPELAAELANLHVATYIEGNLQLRTDGSNDAAKVLSSNLDSAERALRAAEAELATFKETNELRQLDLAVSSDSNLSLLKDKLAQASRALGEATIKRTELVSLVKSAREALAVSDIMASPIFALAADGTAGVGDLRSSFLTETQVLLDLEAKGLGYRHEKVVIQKKKVQQIRAAIESQARLVLSELEAKLAAIRSMEASHKAKVDQLTGLAKDLDPKVAAYNRLKDKLATKKKRHDMLQGRLATSRLTGSNRLGNIVPHDSARVPTAPSSPRIPLNIAAGAFVSMFFGFALVFGLEFLDRSVKSADDVEQAIGVPVLGLIPEVETPSNATEKEIQEARDFHVFHHPKSQAAECARAIRTNILFSAADKPLNVLTVSSPCPREGKTTSVMYLGTTMAQSGQKVLVIDTDMRRPRLHKAVGVARGRGISNLILGDAEFDDVIKTTEIPNLYVLPCGLTPPNPAELLLTKRFQTILDELASRFDRIILDSPPLTAVADAVVLSKLSDGVILVAKAGSTVRDDLQRAAKQLRDVNAHIFGVVLNDLDLSDRRYGYKYYAYGYSEAETESSNA